MVVFTHYTPFHSLPSTLFCISITTVLLPSALAGSATFYRPAGGVGSCGATLQNNDYIVALGPQDYGGGSNCWKHITVNYYGHSVNVAIADTCESCEPGHIDLSEAAFKKLATLSEGDIQVDWYYSN